MRALALPFFFLFLWAGLASAAWESGLSLPPPAPVVDEAGLLDASSAQRIEGLLREWKARSGVEISVYIASSLRDRAIEDFSMAVAEEWKLGKKKEDRALLFVIAPNERKMRFEVGYGLEGDLTDAYSRRVLDNVVKPYFQSGQYADGILAGLAAVNEKVPLGVQEGEAPRVDSPQRVSSSALVWVLILFLTMFSVLGRLLGFSRPAYRRRGPWGGGGWGGGFGSGGGSSWGGGGGGFSGGGASSSW